MDIVKAALLVNQVPECTCALPGQLPPPVVFTLDPDCPIHQPTMYSQQDIDDESGVGTEPAE